MFKSRAIMILLVISLVVSVGTLWAQEKKKPVGTIEIDQTQFGFIIGGSKGEGILHFKGKDYRFKTGGFGVGGAGVAKVSAVGEVYDLDDISKFPGRYKLLRVGAAVGVGRGGLNMINDHGVILNLKSKMQGVALTMGVDTVEITLVK